MFVIFLYVLKLDGAKYYVGQTSNTNSRFDQHNLGEGAQWTKLHKPVQHIHVEKIEVEDKREAMMHENRLTIESMEQYGWKNVRGGDFNSISEDKIAALLEDIFDIKENKRRPFVDRPYFFGPTSHWLIYILSLENGKFYIGSTKRLGRSVGDHFSGKSSKYTRDNKPQTVIEVHVIRNDSGLKYLDVKKQKFNEYVEKYGITNVMGGQNNN